MTALSSRGECVWEFPNKIIVVEVLENSVRVGGQLRRDGDTINDFVVFK